MSEGGSDTHHDGRDAMGFAKAQPILLVT